MLKDKLAYMLCVYMFFSTMDAMICAQTLNKIYVGSHSVFTFSKNGTYELGALFSDLSEIGYKSQYVYSFGYYKKKGKYLILNADSSIINNQGEGKLYTVRYATSKQKGKLTIRIDSQYENLLNQFQDYIRIYNYTIITHLSNGEIIYTTDSNNLISLKLDSLQTVSKVELIIHYQSDFYIKSDSYSFTHSPYCHITLDSIPSDSNTILVDLPLFEYFTLTYAPYQNYKIKILNKHQIFANGEIFIDTQTNYRMAKRKQRKHLLNPNMWTQQKTSRKLN